MSSVSDEKARYVANRVLVMVIYIAMYLGLMIAVSMHSNAAPAPASFAPLTKKLLQSVVNIRAAITEANTEDEQNDESNLPQIPKGLEDFFRQFGMPMPNNPNRGGRSTSMGSGFIIENDGIVVTNNHVIDKADQIYVTLQSGEEFPAELIGTDPKTDLAVLRFDAGDIDLTAVSFGNSDESEVGDWVLAIGNPLGRLGGSVSAGIISARGRNINAGPYDDFIQTDAAINRGNSGGPLFNMDGEVIGINSMIISPNGGSIGLGFSVPSNLASSVIDQLLEYGSTRRGWLGVLIQDITPEIAESLGDADLKGALVTEVTKDGPAEKSGLLAGDLIVTFNNKTVESSRKLPTLVAQTPVGEDVEVIVVRGGEPVILQVVLGQLEKAEQNQLAANEPAETEFEEKQSQVEILGMVLSEITDEITKEYQLDMYSEGLMILSTNSGSKAESLGLSEGDVIVKINQKPIKTIAEIQEQLEIAQTEERKNVLLFVKSQNSARFIALPLPRE